MHQKTDQRIVQSEKAIIEAGIRALLINPSAGMSEIARIAGIGRATLYRHFTSRDELVRKLALVCLKEIDEAVEPYDHLKGRPLIEAIIEVTVPLADRFRFLIRLWSFVEQDKEVERINTRMQTEMEYVFNQAQKLGDVRADLPAAWIAEFFDTTLTAAWTLVDAKKITSGDAVKYMKLSFFHGCGNVG